MTSIITEITINVGRNVKKKKKKKESTLILVVSEEIGKLT